MSGSFDRRTPSEHLLTAMVEALYAGGHTVHILQKDTEGPKEKLPSALVRLGVTTTCIRSIPPAKHNFIARFLTDAQYVLQCRQWLKKNIGFDRVFMQSSNVAGLQASVLKGCMPNAPVTFNVQDIFPENAVYSHNLSGNGVAYRILSRMQRSAYRYADKIITISEDMKDQLTELGVPGEKVAVIYNWSYRDEPYAAEELDCTVARSLLPEAYFNVVYAGNIGRVQNVDILVDAAEQMRDDPQVRFYIIGDGLYKERLKERAQESGLQNLFFLPMQDSALAPSIYATADVNVIPLAEKIYKTALPSKTATCLACGKPVVFCFGARSKFVEMVGQEAGCQNISAKDARELCAAIRKLKEQPAAGDLKAVFLRHMQKTVNAEQYTKVITDHG